MCARVRLRSNVNFRRPSETVIVNVVLPSISPPWAIRPRPAGRLCSRSKWSCWAKVAWAKPLWFSDTPRTDLTTNTLALYRYGDNRRWWPRVRLPRLPVSVCTVARSFFSFRPRPMITFSGAGRQQSVEMAKPKCTRLRFYNTVLFASVNHSMSSSGLETIYVQI